MSTRAHIILWITLFVVGVAVGYFANEWLMPDPKVEVTETETVISPMTLFGTPSIHVPIPDSDERPTAEVERTLPDDLDTRPDFTVSVPARDAMQTVGVKQRPNRLFPRFSRPLHFSVIGDGPKPVVVDQQTALIRFRPRLLAGSSYQQRLVPSAGLSLVEAGPVDFSVSAHLTQPLSASVDVGTEVFNHLRVSVGISNEVRPVVGVQYQW